MKYRRLTKEELQELEREFVRFLASNSITAPEWEKLKIEEPEKADGLIDIFSDIVFEQTLKKVRYLELKMPKDLRTFYCLEHKIHMIGILIDGDSTLDFTQNLSPEQMTAQLQLSGAQLKLYQGEKTYQKDREQELFELMQMGALISKDGGMYKTLMQLIQGKGGE